MSNDTNTLNGMAAGLNRDAPQVLQLQAHDPFSLLQGFDPARVVLEAGPNLQVLHRLAQFADKLSEYTAVAQRKLQERGTVSVAAAASPLQGQHENETNTTSTTAGETSPALPAAESTVKRPSPRESMEEDDNEADKKRPARAVIQQQQPQQPRRSREATPLLPPSSAAASSSAAAASLHNSEASPATASATSAAPPVVATGRQRTSRRNRRIKQDNNLIRQQQKQQHLRVERLPNNQEIILIDDSDDDEEDDHDHSSSNNGDDKESSQQSNATAATSTTPIAVPSSNGVNSMESRDTVSTATLATPRSSSAYRGTTPRVKQEEDNRATTIPRNSAAADGDGASSRTNVPLQRSHRIKAEPHAARMAASAPSTAGSSAAAVANVPAPRPHKPQAQQELEPSNSVEQRPVADHVPSSFTTVDAAAATASMSQSNTTTLNENNTNTTNRKLAALQAQLGGMTTLGELPDSSTRRRACRPKRFQPEEIMATATSSTLRQKKKRARAMENNQPTNDTQTQLEWGPLKFDLDDDDVFYDNDDNGEEDPEYREDMQVENDQEEQDRPTTPLIKLTPIEVGIDSSEMRRSVGLTREVLNQHLSELGLLYFGQTVLSSKKDVMSHMTLNFQWNDLPRTTTEVLKWHLGPGPSRLKKVLPLDPKHHHQEPLPIFWDKKRKSGGGLCHYMGHFKCIKFERGLRFIYKQEAQAVLEFQFCFFDEEMDQKLTKISQLPAPLAEKK